MTVSAMHYKHFPIVILVLVDIPLVTVILTKPTGTHRKTGLLKAGPVGSRVTAEFLSYDA